MLEILGLTVDGFGGFLIDSLSLDVRGGEVLGLCGPCGCGKSLLLASLAGRARLREGQVRWNGRRLTPRLLRDPRRVMLVSDRESIEARDLGVPDCLSLAASLLGRPAQRAREAAELFGLAGLPGTVPVCRLPSGRQELLRLALAELAAPQVLLLDHPLAHLDGVGRERLDEWLDRIRAQQGVLVWAGGSPERLARTCDRVALLIDGRTDEVLLRDAPEMLPQLLEVVG